VTAPSVQWTVEDRRLLNQLAEQARHWQDIDDLREQAAELRARHNEHNNS
jgi:hypothetical protein